MEPILSASNISKSFIGVRALKKARHIVWQEKTVVENQHL